MDMPKSRQVLRTSNAYAVGVDSRTHARSMATVATESPHRMVDRHRLRAVNRPTEQAIRSCER